MRRASLHPDLELTKRGAQAAEMELDILCIRDGELTLGEAKKRITWGNEAGELQEIGKVQATCGTDRRKRACFCNIGEQLVAKVRNILFGHIANQMAVTLFVRDSDL